MRGLISAIAFAGFLSLVLQPQAVAGDWRFSGVERVVAISDVHGAYDAMISTLTKAGVLGQEQGWSGGATHLVITGDILDRGPDSRKVMDLLMRLESEALDDGGRVHLLLGNHEIMNLIGDLRYVSKEEYAAFADDESEQDREKWFDVYRKDRSNNADIEMLRHEYTRKYPPGFFGLRHAFSSRGKYGPWLMTKPLMVVINGTAFVHGGLSSLVAKLGLDGVNGELKSQVSDYVVLVDKLVDEGVLDPTNNFYEHEDVLGNLSRNRRWTPEVNAAIRTVLKLNKGSIHSPDSPLWYRGTVGCGPLIEEDKLAASLAALDAERVVIGHTPTLTRRVLQRMDGRVIEIDTGMLKAAYQGSGNALVIEGDAMHVVGEVMSEDYQPVAHPRRVGFRSESLGAKQLIQILASGDITPTSTPESGKTTVNVTHFGESVAAVFEETARGKDVYPELAAYRLDVMIGLGMVPATVARELGGKQGSLQFIPGSMIDDVDRAARRRGGSAWCPLADQWQAMYVFDALTYNQGRSRRNMLYSVDNWQLILAEHKYTFSARRGFPRHVANMETQTGEKLKIGGGWKIALAELTDDYLDEELGDVLDKNRIKAIARRRDDLLKR
jgi:hypothetical protein